jgi:hypothetical protein
MPVFGEEMAHAGNAYGIEECKISLYTVPLIFVGGLIFYGGGERDAGAFVHSQDVVME